MMKLYAVVDKKAKHIVATFSALSDEAAERSFLSLLTGPDNNIYTDWPADFALYPVAELKFNAGQLVVSSHGLEHVNAAGFRVDTFTVSESIKDGADYDKRFLELTRQDRFIAASASVPRETNSKEDSKDE